MSPPTILCPPRWRQLALAGLAALCAAAAAGGSAQAAAGQPPALMCAYDPSGQQGDAFMAAQRFADAALGAGVSLQPRAYTDERTALEDFRARRCPAVMLTGLRARQLVPFSGTIEALGGVDGYPQLAEVVRLMASPAAARLMQHKGVQTVAVVPAGAVFLFVRDRQMASVAGLAGRRIAALSGDEAARTLIDVVGAAPLAADIGTFAPMFNNGSCDACYAPALAYGPLELHRGLGEQGGIVRQPLAQLTFQVLVHADALPEGLGPLGRSWSAQQLPDALGRIAQAERQVPARRWLTLEAGAARDLQDKLAQARQLVAAKGATYDPRMLKVLHRVRCAAAPQHRQCQPQAG